MKLCVICSEPTFGNPNKEVPSVKFTTVHPTGPVSTGYYWPLKEPAKPALCYLHAKMDAGLLSPVDPSSAYVEWLREQRGHGRFAAPKSMRQLEAFLNSIRNRNAEALQGYESGSSTGDQTRDPIH